MQRLQKPIVGSINGVAAGAGLNIALAADLRIARRGAEPGVYFVGSSGGENVSSPGAIPGSSSGA